MADLMEKLDGPRTAQQELFYDLEDATAVLAWSVAELTTVAGLAKSPDEAIALNLEQSCIDLGKLAEKLSDADAIALMGLVGTLYEEADRLVGYAEEVKTCRIKRATE